MAFAGLGTPLRQTSGGGVVVGHDIVAGRSNFGHACRSLEQVAQKKAGVTRVMTDLGGGCVWPMMPNYIWNYVSFQLAFPQTQDPRTIVFQMSLSCIELSIGLEQNADDGCDYQSLSHGRILCRWLDRCTLLSDMSPTRTRFPERRRGIMVKAFPQQTPCRIVDLRAR
jgi:hypothetical protein